MPSNNWDKIHMWQNRAGNKVDKAIAREKKLKALGEWKEPKAPKGHAEGTFLWQYPHWARWERKLEDVSRRRVDDILTELRDYGNMNQVPRQAYDWLKGHYADEVTPEESWAQIKGILGW